MKKILILVLVLAVGIPAALYLYQQTQTPVDAISFEQAWARATDSNLTDPLALALADCEDIEIADAPIKESATEEVADESCSLDTAAPLLDMNSMAQAEATEAAMHDDDMMMDDHGPTSAATSAVYGEIQNHSQRDETLIAVTSNVASQVEIHLSSVDEQGIARMEEQKELLIPAGESLLLEPGALHIMLMGLNQPLNEGDSITVTLIFSSGLETPSTVIVKKP
ncbi:hypothetical protein MASR2M15_18330 [Anaerolineales bacterium]